MRIAYVCADPGIPVFGTKGASIHVQEVIRAMRKRGAEVQLFTARPGDAPPADLHDLAVHALPELPRMGPAEREQEAMANNHHLLDVLQDKGPFDCIYERYSLWSWAGMAYAQSAGIPSLLEVNAPLIEEQSRHRELVHRQAAEEIATRVFSTAQAIIAVSPGVAAYLASYSQSNGRVHTIANGINPDRFPAKLFQARQNSPAKDTFTIGFLGTLKPWHGLDLLMQAFIEMQPHDPGLRLLLVGDGPERTTMATCIAEAGLDSCVTFTGAVVPQEVAFWLSQMDVGVAPYPDMPHFYFSPLKIYEYMAAALPVVASRVGQLDMVVQEQVTGLLYPAGDTSAFKASLQLLRARPALRRQLGQEGRRVALKKHSWDSVVARIFNIAGLDKRG